MNINLDTYIRRGHPVLFGLLIIFSIIEGSISAWLVARFDEHHNYPSFSVRDQTRFLLFASWWTFLGSFILWVLFMRATEGSIWTSVASHGIFLTMTWVFWFAGSIAITTSLNGGTNCSGVRYNLVYCNQLNALIAFAWICWAFTSILLLVVIIRGIISLRRGEGARGQLVNP